MPGGTTAVVPSSSVPFNVASNPSSITMTTIRTDDPGDLLPSEYQDPWPPSNAEIEMMEWLKEQEELDRSIPDAAERNRNLK
jgi:hypothetical protein